jgi:putative ABC transport system permease protein
MGTLMQDLRYAIRQAVKQPGFTAIVVLSLALGIGANTMIFSLVNALLLRSLPYSDPARVMVLWFTPPGHPEQNAGATNAECQVLRERTQSFEHIGCARPYVPMNLSDENQDAEAAERLIGQQFTADLTASLGVKPVIGRWHTLEEEQPGADQVMLISYRLWQRRFGGSSSVLGKKVYIASQNSMSSVGTIIGVLPKEFDFFNPTADYWFPMPLPPDAMLSPTRGALVAARLKPGVTMAQAQEEMKAFASSLGEEMPATTKGWGIRVEDIQHAYLGGFRNPLLILQGVVAFVLLIACANVAGLLLAQGVSQHKELAIRAALGSGRSRIMRQLLTGNVLLAIMGGITGLAIGWGGLRLVVYSLPEWLPRMDEITIDKNVLGFTLALSILTGFIFGVLPALQVSRPDLMDALRHSTRSTTAGGARQRMRSAFVVLQVSLALVLLVGAGLMINSFLRLYAVTPGFDPEGLMTFQIPFSYGKFVRDTGRRTPSGSLETEITPLLSQTSEQVRERLTAIPGVQSAAYISTVPPLVGFARQFPFTIGGKQPDPAEQEAQSAEFYPVSSKYFETLEIPVLRGREFTAADSAAGQPVVLVNSTMAKRFWPDEDAIGKQIQLKYFNEPPRQIVGIVGDVRQNARNDIKPQVYLPIAQLPVIQQKNQSAGLELITFVVRSKGDAKQLTAAFRPAVAEVDRTQPVFHVQPLDQYISDQMQGFRQYVLMLGVFGGVALILALIGIYGIMAHAVTQRTNEIGVRMALGATSRQVLGVVLRRGMLLISIGLLLGLGGALALTRIISSQLWGVTATDPLTFVLVVAGLGSVALLACYIPARRALKVNPVIALRYE